MGKIRRFRQKYHTSATKNDGKQIVKDSGDFPQLPLPPPSLQLNSNIFKEVVIDYDAIINQKLPEFDKISVKLLKNTQEKALSKKEKRELKRQAFLKKIDVIKQTKKEVKAAKKRRKNVVVGDLKPLTDALPTLECLKKEIKTKKDKKKPRKLRSIEKSQTRHKETLKDIKLFRQVLKDPTYKANLFGTILEHVKNMVEIEKTKQKSSNATTK